MKTGTDVVQSAYYSSECCLAEVELQKKAMFPRCPKCLKLTRWDTLDVRALHPEEKAA